MWRSTRRRPAPSSPPTPPPSRRPPSTPASTSTSTPAIPTSTGRALDVDATYAALRPAPTRTRAHPAAHAPHRRQGDARPAHLRGHREGAVRVRDDVLALRHGRGRAVNIKNAASHLDGLVLAAGRPSPSTTSSAPARVSAASPSRPRSRATRCRWATAAAPARRPPRFAAALFGALDIEERHSHSRPSHYAPIGLDATVSYPLRPEDQQPIQLPGPLPRVPPAPHGPARRDPRRGSDRQGRVLLHRRGDGGLRAAGGREGEPEAGPRVLHQKGIPGFEVMSWVRVRYPDGREGPPPPLELPPRAGDLLGRPGYDVAALPPAAGAREGRAAGGG